MSIFKKFALVVGLLALSACGAPEDGEYAGGDELGDLEQAFGGEETTTYQYGTRNSTTEAACNKVSAAQACMVLRGVTGTVNAKVARWNFTPAHGFTAVEQAYVRSAITLIDSGLSKWTFTESAGVNAIQIGKLACSGASTSTQVDAFRCLTWDNPQNLTEDAGTVGSYQSASVVLGIDAADIVTRAAVQEALVAGNQDEHTKLFRHIAVNGFLAAIGQGTRDDAQSAGTYHDRTIVMPGSNLRPVSSAGADCQAEGFVHFSDGQYTQGGICAD